MLVRDRGAGRPAPEPGPTTACPSGPRSGGGPAVIVSHTEGALVTGQVDLGGGVGEQGAVEARQALGSLVRLGKSQRTMGSSVNASVRTSTTVCRSVSSARRIDAYLVIECHAYIVFPRPVNVGSSTSRSELVQPDCTSTLAIMRPEPLTGRSSRRSGPGS